MENKEINKRTWIKFDISPDKKKLFKKKCKKKGIDMSLYLKSKINEFLLED